MEEQKFAQGCADEGNSRLAPSLQLQQHVDPPLIQLTLRRWAAQIWPRRSVRLRAHRFRADLPEIIVGKRVVEGENQIYEELSGSRIIDTAQGRCRRWREL